MKYRWLCVASLILAPITTAQELNPDIVGFGRTLFQETRFSNTKTDMEVSCASCHALTDPLGSRAFTELFQRSWYPWRSEDPGRETLRNAPTLLDVGQHKFIHMDGEFQTLEEQASATFVGRNFGWLAGEEKIAGDEIARLFNEDDALSKQFQDAFGKSSNSMSPEVLIEHLAIATADFMRTLKSRFDSPYDVFVKANGIPPRPIGGQTPKRYAGTILERLYALETNNKINFVPGFEAQALEGYRIFLRTDGRDSVGNCVSCHVPPLFMDNSYHNTGVSQMEYENVHGVGAFEEINIPTRINQTPPARRFGSTPHRTDKSRVDLGHWNFADAKTSPMFQDGDTQENFFTRTIAAFKTPTLRHLGSTDPYMHSGEYDYVKWGLQQKIEAAFVARMGQLRNGDEHMKQIQISVQDLPPLIAFLNALNDAGERQIMKAPAIRFDSSYSANYRNGDR